MARQLTNRDKFVRTLTNRQAWPRNVNFKPHIPKSMLLDTYSPFPSNIKYGRPRSIDRTPFGPDPEPELLDVAVEQTDTTTFIFTVSGGEPPYSMAVDAGEPFSITSPYEHNFVEPGTYSVAISDSSDPVQTWSDAIAAT